MDSLNVNPDEAIWEWVREEVTANTCFSTATKVREKVDAFFVGLAAWADEVMPRCRRELQALADQLLLMASQASVETNHVDLTLRSVKVIVRLLGLIDLPKETPFFPKKESIGS